MGGNHILKMPFTGQHEILIMPLNLDSLFFFARGRGAWNTSETFHKHSPPISKDTKCTISQFFPGINFFFTPFVKQANQFMLTTNRSAVTATKEKRLKHCDTDSLTNNYKSRTNFQTGPSFSMNQIVFLPCPLIKTTMLPF